MSVALYIVLEKDIEGFDAFVNGKAVGHADEQSVNDLCAALKVPSLFSFLSQDPDELEDFLLDDDIEDDEVDGHPREEWFSAESGLMTVRALIAHLVANPSALANAEAIVEDLQEYEKVLAAIAEKKTRWHFAIDF